MLIGLRVVLVTLIVLATGAFVVGVALERDAEDSHHETSEASNPESSESEAAHKETGEGESAPSGEGEVGSAHASGESSGGEGDATLLGVDLESTPLVIVVALGSLALAAAVWVRPGLDLLLVLVAVAMVAFAALDVRELVHQLDENREGLALLAAVVAALHLAAAGVAVALRGAAGQAARSQS